MTSKASRSKCQSYIANVIIPSRCAYTLRTASKRHSFAGRYYLNEPSLDVCSVADEISRQKIYRVGEAIADGDNDQVLVTTLAELYDIQKALSRDSSAQLLGLMTSEDLRHQTELRYSSRFGVQHSPQSSNPSQSASKPSTDRRASQIADQEQCPGIKPRQEKPSSNENRKRTPNGQDARNKKD